MDIVLDSSTNGGIPIYAPGDVVSGQVIYNCERLAKMSGNVSISFEGHGYITSDPKISPGPNIEHYQLLFSKEAFLFRAPLEGHQSLAWLFAFTFPTCLSAVGTQWPLCPSIKQRFEPEDHQHGLCVIIRYMLRIFVDQDERREYKEAVKQLQLMPVLRSFPDDEAPRCRVTMAHDVLSASRRQRLKETAQTLLGVSSRRQAANFQASVLMPCALWRGQAGLVSLAVQKGTEGVTMEDPTLVLQSIHLTLKEVTHTISNRAVIRKLGRSESYPNCLLPLHGKPIPVVSGLGVNHFTKGPFLPDFRSVSPFLQRTHVVEIVMVIVEKSTKYSFRLTGRTSIEILPFPRASLRYQPKNPAGSHTQIMVRSAQPMVEKWQ